MSYNNDGGNAGFADRKMYQGNWVCAKCGAAITELPFEPDPSRIDQLKCRDCHRASRQSFGGPRGPRRDFGGRR